MKRIKSFLFAAAPLAIGCAVFSAPAIAADEPLTPYEQSLVCKFSGTCDAQTAQGQVDESGAGDQGVEVGDEAPFNVFTSAKPSAPKPVAGKVQVARSGSGPQLYTASQTGKAVASAVKSYRPAKAKLAQVSRLPVRKNAMDMSVFFGNASVDLDGASRSELNAWARALNAPELVGKTLRIEGHTNAVGNRDYNRDLSERRAQAVKDYLISQGVAANRVEAVGYGFDKPRTGNGRDTVNRRVEIVKTN